MLKCIVVSVSHFLTYYLKYNKEFTILVKVKEYNHTLAIVKLNERYGEVSVHQFNSQSVDI